MENEYDLIKKTLASKPVHKGRGIKENKLDLGQLKKDTGSWRTAQIKQSIYTEFENLAKENNLPVGRVINAVLEDFLKK